MSDIQVVSQKAVTLYGDELLAVKAEDGQVYVSINQMCTALGIAPPMQRRRIREHEILSDGYAFGTVFTEGGAQQAALLRVDLVPLWLIGVQINSVREDVRPKLKLFIQRAADVLSEAFQEGRLTADPILDKLLQQTNSEAVEAYKMLQAMVKLARNQVLIEARLEHQDSRLSEYETRLEAVETVLGDPGRHVTPEQASQISQAVKAIAMKLSDRSGRNEYGGVYGELYRRFGIASYKELPTNRFDAAMDFLNDWLARLTGTAAF